VLLAFVAPVPVNAGSLTVAVAANMQFVFEPLRQAFEAESGHAIQPVVNSSGKLSAQIAHGAPYHVFLSADMDFPQQLFKQGLAVAKPRAYAFGQLVIWSRRDLDLHDWQTLMASNAIKKIALANPKLAPYGQQSLQALAYFKLDAALKNKFVLGESLSQTNQYIDSGAADIGFTARSVVLAPQMAGRGPWIAVPQEAYAPIAQGAVILRLGQQEKTVLAQQFFDFLFSARAQEIFIRYGYLVP
jgi:molybdate transport system substrate-binding protein